MSTFSSANITDGNLVLKESTHRIKIKYSMHQYSIRLHNLGNWLMDRWPDRETHGKRYRQTHGDTDSDRDSSQSVSLSVCLCVSQAYS